MDDKDTADAAGPVKGEGVARGRGRGGRRGGQPDVLLDVPELRVDEIVLDVENLQAHVSVEADVLDLLRLSVGADVKLGGVHLEIRGVEAQALLKVRLDKIAEIIERVLTTVDQNPEIVGQAVRPLAAQAQALAPAATHTVDELTGAATTTAEAAAPAAAPAPAEHAARPRRGRLRRRRDQGPGAQSPP